MSSTKLASIGLAATLVAILPAIPAQATSLTRTFVSSAGSDSNPCTITQPCATFARAYSLTLANGIIAALDPGKYGPLSITGPITVNGNGWAAITGPASGNAITINANSGDKITLIGLEIDGANAPNTIGIEFNSGASLTVRDSSIQNFTRYGINFVPNSSNPRQLFVSNTLISDNGLEGISVVPTGSGATNGVLNHVEIQNNGGAGLLLTNTNNAINMTFSDSVSANNSNGGIIVETNVDGSPANMMVRSSTIANNGQYGLYAAGGGASIRITRSTITGNDIGWHQLAGGQVTSYADNNIEDNGSVNTAPFQIGYK